MATFSKKRDETIPALVYKRALVPVLNTFRGMIKADSLLLWEIFDDRIKEGSKIQKISTYEKEKLCKAFYEFLEEKQTGIVGRLIDGIDYEPSKKAMDGPEKMEDFLKEPKGKNAERKGRYSILKFVEAVTDDKKFEPMEFGYGEKARPRKYIILDDEVSKPIFENIKSKSEKSKTDKLETTGAEKTSPPGAIKMEGISAYHARIKTDKTYTKDELSEKHRNFSIGLNHDRIIMKKVKGGGTVDRCEQLCVLPIMLKEKEGDEEVVIGILKAELYDKNRKFVPEDIEALKSCLPFFAQFIVDSRDGVHELTYSQLCKGKKLAKLLEGISDDFEEKFKNEEFYDVIKKVIDRSLHLFNVFNRDTYIGWTAIAGRINHFIREISPSLGLPEEIDLLSRFEDFRRYDELLLEDISQYREHFIHQFHTFILGLIIILKLGIDKFKTWANNQLKSRRKAFNTPYYALDERSVIRIWFMTSFFHDYAYILQRFDGGMSSFIKKVLKLQDFHIRNDWSQIFMNQPGDSGHNFSGSERRFSTYLTKMASYFVSGEHKGKSQINVSQSSKLIDQIWNAVLTRQDHGPLSALALLDYLASKAEMETQRVEETYLAALAIACHHEGVFQKVADVDGEPYLTLEGFPFVFLLVYCDTAQEWGRRKKNEVDQIEYSSPILDDVEVNLKRTPMEVSTKICYDESHILRVPEARFIKNIAADIEQSFKSRDYLFMIRYLRKNLTGEKDSTEPGGSGEYTGMPPEEKNAVPHYFTSIRFECVGGRDEAVGEKEKAPENAAESSGIEKKPPEKPPEKPPVKKKTKKNKK